MSEKHSIPEDVLNDLEHLDMESGAKETAAKPSSKQKKKISAKASNKPVSPLGGTLLILLLIGLAATVWVMGPKAAWERAQVLYADVAAFSVTHLASDAETAVEVLPTTASNADVAFQALKPEQDQAEAPQWFQQMEQREQAEETASGSVDAAPQAVETSSIDTQQNVALQQQAAQSEAAIEQLQQQVEALQTQLEQQQQSYVGSHAALQLQMYAHWLQQPNNNRFQRAALWQDLAALASLTEAQRQQAQAMHQQAVEQVNMVFAWQKQMKAWDDALFAAPVQATQSILPTFESPWLQWVMGQFSLRPAPKRLSDDLQMLRLEWQQVIHQLAMEQWLDDATWQTLLARMQAQLQQQGVFTEADATALPSSFQGLAAGTQALRSAAQGWLKP